MKNDNRKKIRIITIILIVICFILIIYNDIYVPKLVGNATVSYKIKSGNFILKNWSKYKINGSLAGTKRKNKKMYSLVINYDEKESDVDVKYKIFTNGKWSKWISEGKKASSFYPISAIRLRTKTKSGSRKYRLYYRTYINNYGWLGWTTDDVYYNEISGMTDKNKNITAIEIKPVKFGVEEKDLGKYLPNYNEDDISAIVDDEE